MSEKSNTPISGVESAATPLAKPNQHEERTSAATVSRFQIGDVVMTDEGRIGTYHGDGQGTYGGVLFLDGLEPNYMALPWNALSAPSGLWRCLCPRFWNIATSPALRCEKCGASRG